MEYLIGNESASNFNPATQVYRATHERGGLRLPFMYRSFISFSFGGKPIEDFGLIAVTDGDRLERQTHSPFEDITENYEVYDGTMYWGTHHNGNTLELTLATDGITEKQLDDFKAWFKPGITRELILAEHPNRAIMARISQPPTFSFLAFEEDQKVKILEELHTTKISMYRGEIKISFAMEEPFWYGRFSLIYPTLLGEGANGTINLKEDSYRLQDLILNNYKDTRLYVKYKDGNPGGNYNIITDSVLIKGMEVNNTDGTWVLIGTIYREGEEENFRRGYPDDIISIQTLSLTMDDEGSGVLQTTKDSKDYAKIVAEDNIPYLAMIKGKDHILLGQNISAGEIPFDAESRIFNTSNEVKEGLPPNMGAHVQFYGYIGVDVQSGEEEIKINAGTPQYLYYSGTAPSKPILEFTFRPRISDKGYVSFPYNSYITGNSAQHYNYIKLEDNYFKFTTPGLLTGYNQAINIVRKFADNQGTFIELLAQLKEKVNERYSRAWAIFCAQSLKQETIDDTFKNNFITRMKYFICNDGTTANEITCSFNSKNGEAKGKFNIRAADKSPEGISNEQIKDIVPELIEENIGDMVKSNYLIIDGRCYPNSAGYVTKRECKKIETDSPVDLTNFVITFKNMYY